ncbi:hypothetical protein BD310DRAFT_923308 [Dichomitus squalens]|uniref:Uncharacterized protein n=1 Tax=Dichomitus squalens TaxID=114155 RepID=A0A4Q9PZU1_9APHY|nr:hypothetical protein BD310DRAFT_923308 [Dichomitus squalens]
MSECASDGRPWLSDRPNASWPRGGTIRADETISYSSLSLNLNDLLPHNTPYLSCEPTKSLPTESLSRRNSCPAAYCWLPP